MCPSRCTFKLQNPSGKRTRQRGRRGVGRCGYERGMREGACLCVWCVGLGDPQTLISLWANYSNFLNILVSLYIIHQENRTISPGLTPLSRQDSSLSFFFSQNSKNKSINKQSKKFARSRGPLGSCFVFPYMLGVKWLCFKGNQRTSVYVSWRVKEKTKHEPRAS